VSLGFQGATVLFNCTHHNIWTVTTGIRWVCLHEQRHTGMPSFFSWSLVFVRCLLCRVRLGFQRPRLAPSWRRRRSARGTMAAAAGLWPARVRPRHRYSIRRSPGSQQHKRRRQRPRLTHRGDARVRRIALRSNTSDAPLGNASIFTTLALRKNARPVLRLLNPPSLSATSMSAPCSRPSDRSPSLLPVAMPWRSCELMRPRRGSRSLGCVGRDVLGTRLGAM